MTSRCKTTVAALRAFLGIKDFEFAEIIKRSTATVHSLESGRLKLSDQLAWEISIQTGVALGWLKRGDPKAPMRGHSAPYSRELFARARAKGISDFDLVEVLLYPLECYAEVRSILRSALKRGNFEPAAYKLEKALKQLEREFGRDAEKVPMDKDFKRTIARLVKHDLKHSVEILSPIPC